MKKGLILSFEFPPHPGGIGTYSYQIAANLHKMGLPVMTLVTPNIESDAENKQFDDSQTLPIFRFRRWRLKPLKALGRVVETLLFCRRHKIEWILACSLKASYGAVFCKYVLGIPYFLTGYGSEFALRSVTKRFLLNEAAGLFAISGYTAKLMQLHTNNSVVTIPLGADIEHYHPEKVRLEDICRLRELYSLIGSPLLLSVARLNPRKGHDITLKALTKIKAQYPNAQLVIIGASMAGEEAYEADLRRFVAQEQLNVIFIQKVSFDELRAFYSLVDVFVLSSRNYHGDVEGFGIVLIEANLMGLPVVASNSGGIVDAVENDETGFLYCAEDADDLARKILVLLDDKLLRENMGERGRNRALAEFNWNVVADRTWHVIEKSLYKS